MNLGGHRGAVAGLEIVFDAHLHHGLEAGDFQREGLAVGEEGEGRDLFLDPRGVNYGGCRIRPISPAALGRRDAEET